MNRRTFVKTLPALTVLASTTSAFAQDTPKAESQLKPITLPKPEMNGGKSVLAALKERKTTRNVSTKELSPQVLSNLLWAAFGVNREKGSFNKPGRTAASEIRRCRSLTITPIRGSSLPTSIYLPRHKDWRHGSTTATETLRRRTSNCGPTSACFLHRRLGILLRSLFTHQLIQIFAFMIYDTLKI
jgi:hypothetical protein